MVSVIVPIYNAAGTIPLTAPSWLSQDTPAEWLLVDDGSTDETRHALESLVDGHPSFRLLRHEENRGRAAARNTGIAAARGAVLLFLDADMRPETDFVRQHASLHRDPHTIGVVSHPILEGLDLSDPYHRYLRSRSSMRPAIPGVPIAFRYFIIGYTSVKAEAVRAIGGFDERIRYGEDIDFAYRLQQRYPDRLFYSDAPVVHHYDHDSLADRLQKLRAFGRESLPLLLSKHPALARAANLDFVASPGAPSLSAWVKRMALRMDGTAALMRLVPFVPAPLNTAILRYIMAVAISESYRSAVS